MNQPYVKPKFPKYIRRQFVVYPYLQYRLIVIWGISMVLIFGLLYSAIIKFFEGLTEYVRQSTLDNQELLLYLEGKTETLEIYILIGFSLFVLLFFYVQLSETNRIAGPIFNLTRKMKLSREQGKLEPVKFRKEDYFVELATEYNLLVEKFQKSAENGSEDQ